MCTAIIIIEESGSVFGCLRTLEDLGFSTQSMHSWVRGCPAVAEVDNIHEKWELTMVASAFRLVRPVCLQLPFPEIGLHITALPGLTGFCEIKGRIYIQVTILNSYLILDFEVGSERNRETLNRYISK